MSGQLVLVATPIGNLADMSFRAVETLKSATVIACEDTRHTRKLLNHYDIRNVPVMAVHEHNEAAQAIAIVERVRNGETVAMVTDAGMPGISDPGERVVAAVAAADLTVSAIPGASAGITALAVSGIATDRFVFEGFLPRKGSERAERIAALATEQRTTILYESPNRVAVTLQALREKFGGERQVAVVRELTKIHEQTRRGSLQELVESLSGETLKGECVIVLAGAAPVAVADDETIRARIDELLAFGATKRDAINQTADELHVPKNRVYDLAAS